MPFQNRQGGSRTGAASTALQALLADEAEALSRKGLELALAGHSGLLKFFLERVLQPPRMRALAIPFRELRSLEDLAQAQLEVVAAMGRGELSPEEAEAAGRALDNAGTALERRDVELRLQALEQEVAALRKAGEQK
jgi:hypothetical protein